MKALLLACGVVAAACGPAAAQVPRDQATQAGSAGVAVRLQSLGYKDIRDLRRGPDGQWTGRATRNGVPAAVTVRPGGGIIAR